jgi:hypothetical protein
MSWENSVKATANQLSGETPAQMAHANRWKQRNYDCSVDLDVKEISCQPYTDLYIYTTMRVYMGLKFLVFFIPLTILQLPTALTMKLFYHCVTLGPIIDRGTFAFKILVVFAFIMGTPVALVVCFSFTLDCIFYYLMSLPVFLITRNWQHWEENQRFIAPYRNGPSFMLHLTDVLVGAIRVNHMLGCIKCSTMYATMCILVPTLKYYDNCNPLTDRLHERYIQQITTSMQDMAEDDVVRTVKQIISDTQQTPERLSRLVAGRFIPHYPNPPPSRRWVVGVQSAISSTSMNLLTHVTHADAPLRSGASHLVLSTSAERPIYRVMLWYNNPFHFLTGWVEASISSGEPSQTNKRSGGEHPMWIVGCNSPRCNDRNNGNFMYIDKYFDKWLPTFVDEVRWALRGGKIAMEMHQEVISKHGISSPKPMSYNRKSRGGPPEFCLASPA